MSRSGFKFGLEQSVVGPYQGDGVERTLHEGKNSVLYSKDSSGRAIPVTQRMGTSGFGREASNLGQANMMLGVVNVALGVYNAVQISKVKSNLSILGRELQSNQQAIEKFHSEFRSYMGSVTEVMQQQAEMLAAIGSAQKDTNLKLDILIYCIDKGFTDVLRGLDSLSLKMQMEEYLLRYVSLQRTKEELVKVLIREGSVNRGHAERLRAKADELIDYVDVRLLGKDLPVEARQPWLLVRMEADITRQDALLFLGGINSVGPVVSDTKDCIAKICSEIEHIHRGATPWAVLTVLGDQTTRYAILKRSLEKRIEMLQCWFDAPKRGLPEPQWRYDLGVIHRDADAGEGGRETNSHRETTVMPDLKWDNALGSFEIRPVGYGDCGSGMDAQIPLTTMADYRWFISAFGVNEKTFDVHSTTVVRRNEAYSLLGGGGGDLALADLKKITSPNLWRRYSLRVEEEFNVPVSVGLVSPSISPSASPEEPEGAQEEKAVKWARSDSIRVGDSILVDEQIRAKVQSVDDGGLRVKYEYSGAEVSLEFARCKKLAR